MSGIYVKWLGWRMRLRLHQFVIELLSINFGAALDCVVCAWASMASQVASVGWDFKLVLKFDNHTAIRERRRVIVGSRSGGLLHFLLMHSSIVYQLLLRLLKKQSIGVLQARAVTYWHVHLVLVHILHFERNLSNLMLLCINNRFKFDKQPYPYVKKHCILHSTSNFYN